MNNSQGEYQYLKPASYKEPVRIVSDILSSACRPPSITNPDESYLIKSYAAASNNAVINYRNRIFEDVLGKEVDKIIEQKRKQIKQLR